MNKIPILFRYEVNEIPSTTYGTFAIYKYPAKFIPQVIAYILKKYAKPGMKIFDPFAGYGTVGIVSRIYRYNYELWELNPIIEVIHKTAIMKPLKINIRNLLEELRKSREEFVPKWSNLDYWFPEEFLSILSKAWGFVHSLNDDVAKYILIIPLLKVTKYFSYADEKIHKLYKSKYAKKKVEDLLKRNWKMLFYEMLEREVCNLIRKIEEYNKLKPKDVEYKLKVVDTLNEQLYDDINILITSPPY